MPRFYIDAPLRAGSSCALPEETAHHALHVLRLRGGDEVTLFNGRGGEYAGRIASLGKRELLIDVLQHRFWRLPALSPDIHYGSSQQSFYRMDAIKL